MWKSTFSPFKRKHCSERTIRREKKLIFYLARAFMREKGIKLSSRGITMYESCVLIIAMSSGQRCPSTRVGNWKRCTRHLSSCRCSWYHRLPVTRPRLIDSRFFTRTHPLFGISSFCPLPSHIPRGYFLLVFVALVPFIVVSLTRVRSSHPT